jgi:hypothetical protein
MKSVITLRAILFLVLSLTLAASAQVYSKQPGPSDSRSPSGGSEEDLSTASLSTSQLHADRPELVEKSDGDGFVREFVNVQWRPGDNIYLYVVHPTHVAKPPVVIYLYGHPSETDRYQDDGWCKRVTAGGFAAAGFVPALTGHRYHNRPMKQWFVSELQESLAKSAHDVQMVLDYLGQRGDLDMSHAGMFGAGAGGTIAVMAASVDPRITAIDLLDPWGDWPTWMAKSEVVPDEERPDYVKPEFLKKVADFDPVVLLPKVKTQRIRLIQISEDSDNTPEDAKKRIEASLPASGESHRYESNAEFYGLVASGGRVFDWLKLQLKPSESDDPGKRQGDKSSEPMAPAPSAGSLHAK